MLRRYCGKLAYELELHGGRRRRRWASATCTTGPGDAGRAPQPTGWWTSTRCSTARPTCGRGRSPPRSSRYLEERYGREWFRRRKAGLLLRELWELGQSLDADRLLRELTGETLSFEPLLERVAERWR